MQIDNLHKISIPVFFLLLLFLIKKKKKEQYFSMLSGDFFSQHAKGKVI